MNAKQEIEKIRAEAEKKIESLKAARVTELDEEIRAAKKAVKAAQDSVQLLEDEKAELLGKKSKATSTAKPVAPELTKEELKTLSAKTILIVKAAGSDGIAIAELHKQTGAHNDNIKAALKLNDSVATSGKGRGTRYFVK